MAKQEFVSRYLDDKGTYFNVYTNNLLEIKNLREKIIKEGSYGVHDLHLFSGDIANKAIKQLDTYSGFNYFFEPTLSNGDPQYINISHIKRWTTIPGYNYVSFDGTKLVEPSLAEIIHWAINPNSIFGIDGLINYKDSLELIPIERQIELAKQVRDSAVFNFEKLVSGKNLSDLIEAEKKGQYFDAKLLREYYNQVCGLIILHEANNKLEETGSVLSLSSYINNK